MDEHSITLGVCTNKILLRANNMKKKKLSAAGHHIHPLVMFKGKNPQTSWFQVTEENIPDLYIATSHYAG
jgi:hypothetical protein